MKLQSSHLEETFDTPTTKGGFEKIQRNKPKKGYEGLNKSKNKPKQDYSQQRERKRNYD